MSGTDRTKLWVAQGFGIGRIPKAPGTFGSLLGLGWFAILLLPGNLLFFVCGCIAGICLSIWLCGEAERITQQSDPGSVVLDEIIALPISFGCWLGLECFRSGSMPRADFFFADHVAGVAGVFIAFRLFDIAKPWPVGRSQKLPGGWGVTADDLLAAIYVNAVSGIILAIL